MNFTVMFIVVIIASILIIFSMLIGDLFNSKIVAAVDDIPVYSDELTMYAEEKRAGIAASFAGEHGISSLGKGFWADEYDGVSPTDALLEAAMRDAVYHKIVQREAALRGVSAPLDYRAFKKALKAENEARISNEGLSAYGPASLSAYQYSSYLMTEAEDALKTALAEEYPPSEQALKDAFYSLEETVRYKDFKASAIKITSQESYQDLNSFFEAFEPQKNIDASTLRETLVSAGFDAATESYSLISSKVHREDIYTLAISDSMYHAQAGDFIQGAAEDQYFYIISKEGGGLLVYEDAPGLGENKYINDLFDAYIAKKTDEAQVIIYDNARAALE